MSSISKLRTAGRILLGPVRALCRRVGGGRLIYPEYGSQTVDAEDIALARSLARTPAKWTGDVAIRRFEEKFAEWNGSMGARSFMGGRVALSAAIYALQLKPGDEVLVPGYTCVVVPNAFRYAGIKIKYVDIELESFGADFDAVQAAITSDTRAILVHHLYGLVARDFERILELARARRLYVIEDCAHAMGASLRGRNVGNFSDVAFYSTEQSKVLSTFNGGLAVTNTAAVLDRLNDFQASAPFPSQDRTEKLLLNFVMSYRLQKSHWRWLTAEYLRALHRKEHLDSTTDDEVAGLRPEHYGQRMPAPLAEIALLQLGKVDRYNALRRKHAEYWKERCERKGLATPRVIEGSTPIFLRYPVMVPEERKFDATWAKREFGIKPGLWFTGELHPVAAPMPLCPNARRAVQSCINLPTLGLRL